MQKLARTLVLLILISASFGVGADEKSVRSFQQILDSGSIRIGMTVYAPWVMRAKDGQLVGSEVDMAKRLAADMGIRSQLSVYEWQELIPALERGDIDVIVSGMGIKPSRALRVNFSRPYGDTGIGLAANTKITSNIGSMDDLKKPNIKLGVLVDSVSSGVAKRMFSKATIVNFTSEKDMESAVIKGDVHAIIAANPLPNFVALKNPGKIDLPLTTPLLSFKEGIAVNKGDPDFLNFLDAWVVARTADAWIPSTRRYWLESLEWQEQVR